MKKAVVIISIFLSACGGASTEAKTDSAVTLIDIYSPSQPPISKFDINNLVGKYDYANEKVMGGYKISGYYELTIKKDFSYHLFKSVVDEYNDNKMSLSSYDGRFKYVDNNLIEFIEGDLGERGGKIYLTESNLNGNVNQLTVVFSNNRGEEMNFVKIVEDNKIIIETKNLLQPGEYEINASIEDKAFFYSKPDLNFMKKSYFSTVEKVYFQKFDGDFGYVEFVNSEGQMSKGWISVKYITK